MNTTKVYQAINKVQRALAAEGISKSRKNQQQGYNFRGIDDIYNTVSPLLGEHGLCVLPRVISRDCVERQTAKGGVLFYVTCQVEFDFVASEDGSKHTVTTWGEAMDSADKATNKAMSAAYKYAIMQAFAIPTEGDNDADSITHVVVPQSSKSIGKADFDGLSKDRQQVITDLATEVIDAFQPSAPEAAYDLYAQARDNLPLVEEKTALRGLLPSNIRTAFTKIYSARQADLINTP